MSDVDKASFVAMGRATLVTAERMACEVCGKFKSLTHAHHVIPLSVQFDRGFDTPSDEHVWLCPTHHAAVHVLIGQSRSNSAQASAACASVIHDLSTEDSEQFRALFAIFQRSSQ